MITEQSTQRSDRSLAEPEQGMAAPPGPHRFPLFDSLRAIAALSVVVFHAGQAADALSAEVTDRWWEPVVARLPVGVTIFFLISGFLLYRPFAAARLHGTRPPSVRDFARRRILRIVPAYWVALLILFPFGLAWFPGGMWPDGLLIFGFLQLYSEETHYAGLGVSWSLSVEAAFYVAIPIYAAVAARALRGRQASAAVPVELAALGVLGVASLAFSAIAYDAGRHALAETLPGNFLAFAFGMGLAVVSAAGWGHQSRTIRLVMKYPSVPWLLSAGTLVFAGTLAGLPELTDGLPGRLTVAQFTLEKALYALIAFFLLLPAVFGDDRGGWPRRVLAAPALMWIGLVSYGIYLWHSGLIHWLRRDYEGLAVLGPDLMFMVVFAIALGLAVVIGAASFYLVEQPVLRFRNGIPLPAALRALPASLRRLPHPLRRTAVTSLELPTFPQRERELSLAVDGGPTAPRLARGRLTELLRDDLAPEHLDAIRLLVSEIVANSVRHGGVGEDGQIKLAVRIDQQRARVDVWDTGRQGTPRMRAPDLRRGDGFGLFLVNRLSSEWGATHEPGLRVWFEVSRESVPAPTPTPTPA